MEGNKKIDWCLVKRKLKCGHMSIYDVIEMLGHRIEHACDAIICLAKRVDELERKIGPTPGPTVVPVQSIDLDASEDTIYAGSAIKAETTVVATVLPYNATNKTVVWRSSDEDIATVNENGEVSATAEGDVEIICEATDGSGVSESVTIHVVEKAVVNTATTYETPVVTLSYGKIPQAGGTVSPTLSYSQKRIVTKTYNDGDTEETQSSITTGGNVGYIKTSGDATLANDGKVTYSSANSSTSDVSRAIVNATVTMNGKSNTSSNVDVRQEKYVAPPAYAYHGADDNLPTSLPAGTKVELTGINKTFQNATDKKYVWVALPSGHNVISWVNTQDATEDLVKLDYLKSESVGGFTIKYYYMRSGIGSAYNITIK